VVSFTLAQYILDDLHVTVDELRSFVCYSPINALRFAEKMNKNAC